MLLKNLKLTFIKREKKEFTVRKRRVEKDGLWLTLVAGPEITDEMIDDLKKPYASDMVPSWLRDYDTNSEENYINMFTKYELPVRIDGVDYPSIEQCIKDGVVSPKNAIVNLSVNITESAIYPKAIQILENGEDISSNPFDEFDN